MYKWYHVMFVFLWFMSLNMIISRSINVVVFVFLFYLFLGGIQFNQFPPLGVKYYTLTWYIDAYVYTHITWASPVAQTIKNLPTMQETWVKPLGWEDPLEKDTATHSSILVWGIPWTEEPGGLQSAGSERVKHDWATNTHILTFLSLSPSFSSSVCLAS